MTALRCERLTLKLSGATVLGGVTASFEAGQWTTIVGPNGAGKSSWLQLLAGLRAPADGDVWLQGRNIADWPARERAQQLAWLSQQGEAEGDIAVRDVVRLGRLPRHGLLGAPDAEDEAAVDAALAETECSALAARRLSALSGGERQRVLLARVLAVGAPVLLLDEPTTHLDAPHQRALCRSLRTRAQAGAAVISVMHDLTLALGADRIVVMRQGRIAADGPPHDAALQAALAEVFEHAFTIQAVDAGAGRRWVAVPSS
jgi:iron complex transport system ATP-binding protein